MKSFYFGFSAFMLIIIVLANITYVQKILEAKKEGNKKDFQGYIGSMIMTMILLSYVVFSILMVIK